MKAIIAKKSNKKGEGFACKTGMKQQLDNDEDG